MLIGWDRMSSACALRRHRHDFRLLIHLAASGVEAGSGSVIFYRQGEGWGCSQVHRAVAFSEWEHPRVSCFMEGTSPACGPPQV